MIRYVFEPRPTTASEVLEQAADEMEQMLYNPAAVGFLRERAAQTKRRPFVYVCSPFRSDTTEGRSKNVLVAQAMCHLAIKRGCIPVAPHLIYPQFLDDDVPEQREQGIAAALGMLERCDEIWVLHGPLSQGMVREVQAAQDLGMPVRSIRQQEALS